MKLSSSTELYRDDTELRRKLGARHVDSEAGTCAAGAKQGWVLEKVVRR